MNNPRFVVPRRALASRLERDTGSGTERSDRRPLRAKPLTRRYEAAALMRDGSLYSFSRIAPAIPVFEQAFSAFARGTLISTDHGAMAVEDLVPGDVLETLDNGPQTLIWAGSMTLYPASIPGQVPCPGPVRVPADSFGPGRPAHDTVLGPHARLLQHFNRSVGREAVFVPVADLIDENSAIRLSPATPVQVYHLALRRHATLRAGGLEVESYHPGTSVETLDVDMRGLFLALFPHIRDVSGFGAPLHPQRPFPGMNFRVDAA